MSKGLNITILIVGLLFGLGSGVLVYAKLNVAQERLRPVYYLAYQGDEPLRSGDVIREQYLGTITLPNSTQIFGEGALLIPDNELERGFVIGNSVNTTIPPGRILTQDLFEPLGTTRLDETVAEGMRAFSINVNTANSLNNRVLPGNRVDIVGTINGNTGARAVVILEDVKVLAVGRSLSLEEFESGGRNSYSTITLELTVEDSLRLSAAKADINGDLTLLLRNQCDTKNPSASCG